MKKLHQISALSAAFLAGAPVVDAQIQYTDIDPDLYTNSPNIYLDIDDDGVNDLRFSVPWSSFFDVAYSWVYAACLHPGVEIVDNGLGGTDHGAKKFEPGEIIHSSSDWITGAYLRLAGYSNLTYFACTEPFINAYGDFYGVAHKFLAFRISDIGGFHYGWIRLTVNYSDPCPLPLHDAFELFVYDFAINNTLNEPIAAGEGAPDDCHAPFPLPSLTGPTYAKIQWEPVPGADAYTVRYRATGAVAWNTKIISSAKSDKLIKGLTCNTGYEWQVNSICDGGATTTDYSPVQNFTTAVCRLGEIADAIEIEVYPNPGTDLVTVNLDGAEGENTLISITDLLGNEVLHIETVIEPVARIDISKLASGTYFLQVISDDAISTIPLVKR